MLGSFNDKREQRVISLEGLASVHQTHAAPRTSSRYKFIPTTRALDVLADYGWQPVEARQARTRIEENEGFQKHAIRLVNPMFNKQMVVGSTIPQIMLTNSHLGTSSFEISAALFEKVCANGLCVSKGSADTIRIMHFGFQDVDVAQAAERMLKQLPETMQRVDEFKNLILTQEERKAFAESAIELRFDGDKYAVGADQLLRTFRAEEKNPTLWNTYNVVQEKIIKGGVRQQRTDGSIVKSREVKNINENIKLNRALWSLTEKMAELKSA